MVLFCNVFTEVIVITLNCVKNAIEILARDFKFILKVIGISEDSEFDTVDSLCLIKDDIKVRNNHSGHAQAW